MSVSRTELRAVLLVPWLAHGLLLVGCASGTPKPPPAPSSPAAAAPGPPSDWVVPDEAKSVQNPVPSSAQALKRGEALFRRHCTPCHGPKGRGDGPVSSYWKELPKDLGDPARQDRLSDGEIFWKLSKGHRQGADVIMPAFSERLASSEDRWKIVMFVRTLRAGTAAKP